MDITDATKGQQVKTVMKEEHIQMFVPTRGECPVELLTQLELELRALED
jgi:hypothetical protein